MKKQKVMSQMKGLDKTPEKQLNEVEMANFQKRIQSSDSEDNPESWEENGEDEEMFYQRPRTKLVEVIEFQLSSSNWLIGPCTSCGKNDVKRASFSGLRKASAFPR